ncbi:MAG: hypothetical protein FJZ85_09050, partial [Chloroflexi bacterium]|nr:hypothetical protein [Chloroflexota bacterium]
MAGSIRCNNCGEEISSSSRFCTSCAARICPGCHKSVPGSVKFCPSCGFAVGASPLASAEQPGLQQPPQAHPTTQPQRPQQPQRQPSQPFPQLDRQPPHPPQAPQPTQQPPSATWTQATTPPPPIPTPRSASEYEVDRQYIKTRGYGSPAEAMADSAQKTTPAEGAWGRQATPRRIPRTLFILMIILGIAIIGLVSYSMGWDRGIISNAIDKASGLLSGIRIPSLTPGTGSDATQLVISNVAVSGVSQTGATISWETDRPATSQVMICDPEGLCTWTDVDKNLVTQHSVALSGLKSDTSYHYKALSSDAKKNETTAEGDLRTLEEIKIAPLLLSAIMVTNTTQSTATITWQSNQPTTSQVEYGTTQSYGSLTTLDARLVG